MGAWLLLVGLPGASRADDLLVALTNDDGWSAPGIQAAYQALAARGHRVVLAAPGGNQSGAGAGVSTGSLRVTRQAAAQYSVWACRDEVCADRLAASPAVSGLVAVDLVRQQHARPPDLLVSGINAGANLGSATVVSGTVGAARVAATRSMGGRIPSIAISTDLPPACGQDAACGRQHYDAVAVLLVNTVEALIARRQSNADHRLLPPGVVLNINAPPARPLGLRAADISPRFYFQGAYIDWRVSCPACGAVAVGESAATRMDFKPEVGDEPVSRSDAQLFSQGYATFSLVTEDGVRVGPSFWRWLRKVRY